MVGWDAGGWPSPSSASSIAMLRALTPITVTLACSAMLAPVAAATELSDEQRLSRWAYAFRPSPIYRDHLSSAPTAGTLRFFTEDGFPEVYLALTSYTDEDAREWIKIRIPRRPNGRTGWVPRDALSAFTVNRQHLTISRKTFRATLRDRGTVVWRARIGVGAPGTPTPAGHFYVREKFRFRDTPVYGRHAIGTSAYAPTLSDWPGGGIIGIHGTNQPELIPGRPSHGCIRVRNPDVQRLWNRIKIGTPIEIR